MKQSYLSGKMLTIPNIRYFSENHVYMHKKREQRIAVPFYLFWKNSFIMAIV